LRRGRTPAFAERADRLSQGKTRNTVSIVGAGVVGCALGKLLAEHGYIIDGVASRSRATAHHAVGIIGSGKACTSATRAAAWARIVFITTTDNVIRDVCARIAAERGFRPGATVIHCSGALSSEALAPARDCGAAVATLHPLQTFASVDNAIELLSGSAFAFEGDQEAKAVCAGIVHALHGYMFDLPTESKGLYHAASCMASNYFVTIFHMAVELMEYAGLGHDEATRILLPLVRGALENLKSVGTPKALTGPIARGDDGTVLKHMKAMADLPPEFRDIYRMLGVQTLRVAREKGTVDNAAARRLMRILRLSDPAEIADLEIEEELPPAAEPREAVGAGQEEDAGVGSEGELESCGENRAVAVDGELSGEDGASGQDEDEDAPESDDDEDTRTMPKI